MAEEQKKGKEQEQEKEVEQRIEHKLLHLSRVAHMKAGGRRFRFRAVVVVGDKNGKVGLAVAKGKDVGQALEKAKRLAQRNMIMVPIRNDTIPHQIETKFGSIKIILKPQIKGKGLIAGGPVRTVCRLAGIKNISSKVISRSKSKMNIAMATIKALQKLRFQV